MQLLYMIFHSKHKAVSHPSTLCYHHHTQYTLRQMYSKMAARHDPPQRYPKLYGYHNRGLPENRHVVLKSEEEQWTSIPSLPRLPLPHPPFPSSSSPQYTTVVAVRHITTITESQAPLAAHMATTVAADKVLTGWMFNTTDTLFKLWSGRNPVILASWRSAVAIGVFICVAIATSLSSTDREYTWYLFEMRIGSLE